MTVTIIVIMAKVIGSTVFTVVAMLSSNMQSIASNDNAHNLDLLFDKANVAELFDIGSGIFALILSALTLTAYRNLKSKRLLFVSAAFGMFAIHAIVSKLDVFIPAIESSVVELIASTIIFLSLALFFLAIVNKSKIKARTRTPPPSS